MKLNFNQTEYLAGIIWKRAQNWDTSASWDAVIGNLMSVRAACKAGPVLEDVTFLIQLAEQRRAMAVARAGRDAHLIPAEHSFHLILDGDYGIEPHKLIQECFLEAAA